MPQTLLVTGGAGFIGSALVRHLIRETDCHVVNVDKLTYAGHLANVAEVAQSDRYHFEQADLLNVDALLRIFKEYRPDGVVHLAAESDATRSVDEPAACVRSNIMGTYLLLEATRSYLAARPAAARRQFRFLYASAGTTRDPEAAGSPYTASKAAADHLVRAWHHTYRVPILVTHGTYTYGPYQYPEQLIPVVILRALAGRTIPVYGRGETTRDWMHVEDHARGLLAVLERGHPGETYYLGSRTERRTLDVIEAICRLLDTYCPRSPDGYTSLIHFVEGRHPDVHVPLDPSRTEQQLGWRATRPFEAGLRQTVAWFLDNTGWCTRALQSRRAPQRAGARRLPAYA